MIQGKLPDMNYDPRAKVFEGTKEELIEWLKKQQYYFVLTETDTIFLMKGRVFNMRFMITLPYDLLTNQARDRTYEFIQRKDEWVVYGLVQ